MAIASMMLSPFGGRDVITTNDGPTIGDVNTYDTTVAGTDLVVPLPDLSAASSTVGTIVGLELSALDVSGHQLIFDCFGSDAFYDGSTSLVLVAPGQFRWVQIIQIGPGGPIRWKVVSGFDNLTAADVTAVATSLVNKTVVTNALSPSTVTINADGVEVYRLTALANGTAISIAGSPVDEQPLKITITDNGTPRALTWNAAQFGVMGVVGGLPANTPGSGRKMSMQFFYDGTFSRWILAAIDTVGYAY